ncbi:MAG: hypothetical protein IT292_11060 [Deltaproteobacteria bacterium]|nr:hypothetical protein [Deltaproteobacteria bacterium]
MYTIKMALFAVLLLALMSSYAPQVFAESGEGSAGNIVCGCKQGNDCSCEKLCACGEAQVSGCGKDKHDSFSTCASQGEAKCMGTRPSEFGHRK